MAHAACQNALPYRSKGKSPTSRSHDWGPWLCFPTWVQLSWSINESQCRDATLALSSFSWIFSLYLPELRGKQPCNLALHIASATQCRHKLTLADPATKWENSRELKARSGNSYSATSLQCMSQCEHVTCMVAPGEWCTTSGEAPFNLA